MYRQYVPEPDGGGPSARCPSTGVGGRGDRFLGTHAWDGQPASSLSVKVMNEKGFDISKHRARLVSPDIINKASLVVALAGNHLAKMKADVPGAGEWMILMGGLEPGRKETDVVDPIGGSLDDYRAVRDDIAHLTALLLSYVAERYELPLGD